VAGAGLFIDDDEAVATLDLSTCRGVVLDQARRPPPFVVAMQGYSGNRDSVSLNIFMAGWEPVHGCVRNQLFNVVIFDWYVQAWKEARRLVGLQVCDPDICLLCYSVAGPREELDQLETFWMPEIRKVKSNCVFAVHAMQVDRRTEVPTSITRAEGLALALRLGHLRYFESSSVTGEGVHEVIGGAIWEWRRRYIVKSVMSDASSRSWSTKCLMQ